MPSSPPTAYQLYLLRTMYDGMIIQGVLGADALHANKRIFFTSDGETINPKQPDRGHQTINSMVRRGLIKVVSSTGEDPPRITYLTITELGRLMAERGQVKVRGQVY